MFARLVRLQVERPWIPLGTALILTAVSLGFASRLRLYTGLESLLPESKPSVIELNRVTKLTTGISTVFVALQGGPETPVAALREAADALVPKLEAVGKPDVIRASTGIHDAVSFLSPRAGLFLSKERLERLRDQVRTHYAKAVTTASGLSLELEDPSPEDASNTFDVAALKRELIGDRFDPNRYPDGYYQAPDGKTLFILIRSGIPNGQFEQGAAALAKIRKAVSDVNLAQYDPHISVDYAGDLTEGVAEFQAINRNLVEVGALGFLLVSAAVLAYFMRLRTLALLMITIGVGDAWTFGFTELAVGRLNAATGFLFTIVTGNGINFAIIYMARYLELRRTGTSIPGAITQSSKTTWLPTLAAGFATGASYGSLAITSFRGFHDFGLIGGMGMVLCWLATFFVLPPLMVVFERIRPLPVAGAASVGAGLVARIRTNGINFAAPFVRLVSRYPKALTVIGASLTLLCTAAAVRWVVRDPMEYDLTAIRTDPRDRAAQIKLDKLGNEVTGHVGTTGMAIVTERPEQVAPLTKILVARRDAAASDKKPFEALHTALDYVPEDQREKVPILLEIGKWVRKARARHAVSDRDWNDVKRLLPPATLKPFGVSDLPASLSAPFTEASGLIGRIVYITPTLPNSNVDNAHYLFRWANAFRSTTLPDGSTVLGSGRAVIYADMWQAVVDDIPKAVVLAFLATLAVVLIMLRRRRATLLVAAVVIQGSALTAGALGFLGIKLNFINFIALPVTFGIAVDYSVNIVERYLHEGPGHILTALRRTGGAVVLCSLTTTLGYIALLQSNNLMIRSMGVAAFIGEVACLLAAMLFVPSVLRLLDRRTAKTTPPAS